MTTGKLDSFTMPMPKAEPVATEDQLRRDASRGVSGHLIGSLTNVASLVHRFSNDDWYKGGDTPLQGVTVLVASAGNRGLMLTSTRPGRRVESRFSGDVPPTAGVGHPNAARWLQGELEALTAQADVRALPMLVVIEPSAAGDLSHEARQRLDRLASENGCVVAVVIEAEGEPRWRPGFFDLPDGIAA